MTESTALIIYPGYVSIQVALARNNGVIDRLTIDKKNASRDLIATIETLLTRNNLTLTSLSFCAAHVGPGPFTTLRSALSTVNGLAFATKIPLIGVDGLDAFIDQEKARLTTRYLVVMLNAFCGDVYFAFYDRENKTVEKGCAAIGQFIERMKARCACDFGPTETCRSMPVTHECSGAYACESKNNAACTPLFTCVGNGAELYKKELATLDSAVYIPDPLPQECSLEAIVREAYRLAHEHAFSDQLLPLYLKSSSARLGKKIDQKC